MIVVDRELVGKEVAVEGTLPMEGVIRTVGLTMIWGVAIALMARAILVMMRDIPGTDLSRRHAPSRVIPVTW